MAVLHHVSISLTDTAGWAALAEALVADDCVVLLDQAARDLQADPPARTWALLCSLLGGPRPDVRWLLPALERTESSDALADRIEVIDDAQWLELIVADSLLMEWS
jgi:hypothetical protein